MSKCNNCGMDNPDTSVFCGRCGSRLTAASTGKICPSCKNTMPDDMIFCDHCGAKWVSTAVETKKIVSTTNETKNAENANGCGAAVIILGLLILVILWVSC